ncbi:phage gp16-like protein [Variovorax boronicumulans]|uniref:regulatory protein GemA n=1 Tax=Variovorax boronicumulans TaxID=436515 RepID=UPI00278A3C59|nr:regulatory protein GemA [Variovorax boronicumulans]MDP9990892.1 phage gp16-like protein [Variovorax boronicumulans]MDQ0002920.1 phage gp16-like protein [Variovorax boronicumulans]
MNPPETVSKKPFPKVTVPTSSWDATRKRELGLIHMAKAHLGLSDADYRFVIGAATATKKTSAADLTHGERNLLLQHFKRQGFEVKAKASTPRPLASPQHRKLRAMWYALADAGAVERPEGPIACDHAVEAWAKRQGNSGKVGQIDALRFADSQQLNKLIEEMKAWGMRVKAQID